MQNTLHGRFWINKSKHDFLGKGRMELLIRIGENGSITKAAKDMKMSYKAAWDAIDAMNNLSEFPLVESSKGGKGGGGTTITEYAKELIQTYTILQEEHQLFLKKLALRIDEKDGHISLLKGMDIRLSARNQLKVKVVEIHKSKVESELTLELNENNQLTATITNDSFDALEIDIGVQLYAIFKANALTINSDISLKKSDVNRFIGKITRINRDSFNAEIIIELDNKNSICPTMSIDIFDELHVGVGTEIVAFCRPKNIILGRW